MINKRRVIKFVSVTLFLLLASRLTAIAGPAQTNQTEQITKTEQINQAEQFTQAEKFYAQKNYSAAAKLLKQYLAATGNHAPSLYLLGNIYLMQRHLTEASECYRACVKVGADTRPGQYAAMALTQMAEATSVTKASSGEEIIKPTQTQQSTSLTNKQEEEKRSILRMQKEAVARNQSDFKIQADKLTVEEEQQIELAPFNQAELRNSEYRLVRENAVAQIKQEFEIKKKALKDIYDRKENAINNEFKRRLGLLGAN